MNCSKLRAICGLQVHSSVFWTTTTEWGPDTPISGDVRAEPVDVCAIYILHCSLQKVLLSSLWRVYGRLTQLATSLFLIITCSGPGCDLYKPQTSFPASPGLKILAEELLSALPRSQTCLVEMWEEVFQGVATPGRGRWATSRSVFLVELQASYFYSGMLSDFLHGSCLVY